MKMQASGHIFETTMLSSRLLRTAFVVGVTLLSNLSTSEAQPAGADGPLRSLDAAALGDAEITLDGRLDEAAWQQATPSSGFTQRLPVRLPGKPVEFDPVVRVLYDSKALYVGVVMPLAKGEVPIAREMARDNLNLWHGDLCAIKIDPNRTGRDIVAFAINPIGTQFDMAVSSHGTRYYFGYDSRWSAKASVTPTEWVAEFRIPFSSMGVFPQEGQEHIMGFNVLRLHGFRNAQYEWQYMPADWQSDDPAHFGTLRSLHDIGTGRTVTMIPYMLFGYPSDSVLTSAYGFRAGGDILTKVTDKLWAHVAILSDFSDVNLDEAVVNTDRFPLFFPERRPFFLTGVGVLSFGLPENTQMFFSRRIGLDANNEPIPMLGGAKLFGQIGNVDVGLLDVMTADPLTNWAAGRARWRINATSSLGLLLTAKNEDGRGDYGVGVDGSMALLDQRLRVDASLAGSQNTDSPRPPAADRANGLLQVRWLERSFQPYASALWVGDDFDPALGFVFRRGIMSYTAGAPYYWYNTVAGITTLKVEPRAQLLTSDEHDDRLGYRAGATVDAAWTRPRITLRAERVEDEVTAPYELFPGKMIVPGVYEGESYVAQISTEAHTNFDPVIGTLTYQYQSNFFGGSLHQSSLNVIANPFARLRLQVSLRPSMARFEGENDYLFATVNGAATVFLTPRLYMDISGSMKRIFSVPHGQVTETDQWNSLTDETTLLGRVQWDFLPGSSVRAVYRFDRLQMGTNEQRFFLKLIYWFDAVL